MPRNRSATHQPTRQAGKIPGSTAGMENRFIDGNVPLPTPCNIVKRLIRQPPIGKRISPLIHTSILNVNVWWYSSSTPADASKVTILVSIGTMDTILCHPREIFRLAIMASAAAIIIAHSHPSGDPTPSEADIKITRDLIRAGQLLKIEVLDHIVIGNPNHSSLRSLGYFYST